MKSIKETRGYDDSDIADLEKKIKIAQLKREELLLEKEIRKKITREKSIGYLNNVFATIVVFVKKYKFKILFLIVLLSSIPLIGSIYFELSHKLYEARKDKYVEEGCKGIENNRESINCQFEKLIEFAEKNN